MSSVPKWRVAGQCAFTGLVLEAALAEGVPIHDVVIVPCADDDPFPNLPGDDAVPCLREHRFHYGGWRAWLREVCAMHSVSLRTGNDLLADSDDLDVLVVAGLAMKVPASTLHHFGARALNVHPSLLPSLRGPQPEARAILQGLCATGTSIHSMTDRFDEGPIRFQERYALDDSITVGNLEAIGAKSAARGLRELARLAADDWPTVVSHAPPSYFRAYGESMLELRHDLTIADARRRLRLRPEGYAFRRWDDRRIFPISVRGTSCGQALRLDFKDGALFVHGWIELTEAQAVWTGCGCPASADGSIAAMTSL